MPFFSDRFIPAEMIFLHGSLSSTFFALRQAVISSESGIYALQSLNTSGVQARRSSGVPCAIELPVEAITESKAKSKQRRSNDAGRSHIQLHFLSVSMRVSHHRLETPSHYDD